MKFPWLLVCFAVAALAYAARQIVVAIVIWKKHQHPRNPFSHEKEIQ